MSFRKHTLSAALAATVFGSVGLATAQEDPLGLATEPFVIEVFVQEDGTTEIICPATACNAVCRDLEGMQVLLQETFYRIGSNCSITITDGALLQEAIETVIALVSEEIPGGFAPIQGLIPIEDEFENTENNPNQNTPSVASPTSAGSL
jgi:hypothetical protein